MHRSRIEVEVTGIIDHIIVDTRDDKVVVKDVDIGAFASIASNHSILGTSKGSAAY
jgi:hypothetical protein